MKVKKYFKFGKKSNDENRESSKPVDTSPKPQINHSETKSGRESNLTPPQEKTVAQSSTAGNNTALGNQSSSEDGANVSSPFLYPQHSMKTNNTTSGLQSHNACTNSSHIVKTFSSEINSSIVNSTVAISQTNASPLTITIINRIAAELATQNIIAIKLFEELKNSLNAKKSSTRSYDVDEMVSKILENLTYKEIDECKIKAKEMSEALTLLVGTKDPLQGIDKFLASLRYVEVKESKTQDCEINYLAQINDIITNLGATEEKEVQDPDLF